MTMMSKARRVASTGLIALLLAGGSVAVASPAEAATKPRACKATVSVAKPKQYTTTVVRVSNVGSKARVTTSAKYKTTTNTKYTTASTKGTASTSYNVARATPGYKVVVTVKATSGKTTWQCSTSYVPRR